MYNRRARCQTATLGDTLVLLRLAAALVPFRRVRKRVVANATPHTTRISAAIFAAAPPVAEAAEAVRPVATASPSASWCADTSSCSGAAGCRLVGGGVVVDTAGLRTGGASAAAVEEEDDGGGRVFTVGMKVCPDESFGALAAADLCGDGTANMLVLSEDSRRASSRNNFV